MRVSCLTLGLCFFSNFATISLMKRELIDLQIELLLLSLFVATSIVCESFLFDSGFVPFFLILQPSR